MGLDVWMVTGDREAVAQRVAVSVGIDHVKASVKPSEKAEIVKDLQRQGHVVAMVGDGINDAAALAQADVGIAMARGTDVAMDVAQMTLMHSDLEHVRAAIRVSRDTVRVIRQNLFWAFIYNIIGIPIAAGVLYPAFTLNPMIAGAAMAMSSVSVVLNSLRLKALR
jgi:Cu2+-exporting ATPase